MGEGRLWRAGAARENMAGVDREEAVARLRSARVGRLATITPQGRPHVVPFVFALVQDGSALRAYWAVDRKPKRSSRIQRLENLERNPAAEILVDGYEEDWSGLWWVRAAGSGRVVGSDAERSLGLDALKAKYPRYETEPPDGPVVAIELERITSWSGAEEGR
jgi:PPOX class probable F420-dependent enzyme